MKNSLVSSLQMLLIAWRSNKFKFALALALIVGGGTAWPAFALALRAGTNAALSHDSDAAAQAGVVIAVAAVAALLLQHFAYVAYAEVCELAVVSLEAELIQLANGSSLIEHHERPEYADKISLLQRQLGAFGDGMVGLMTAVSLAISLMITGILLASLNPWLLLLPAAALPAVEAGQRAQRMIDLAKERSATVTRQATHLFHLATNASSAKELRVLRLQREVRRRHDELHAEAGRVLWAAERRAAALIASGQLLFAAAYVLAVLLVVRQAVAGRSDVGDVVLVITLAAQVNQQVHSGLELLRGLQSMAEGLNRLRWLRALIAGQQSGFVNAAVPAHIRTGIEFRAVAFTYPGTDRPVIDGADLLLPAGSTVALVGENGAGKSSLVKLLCRFYNTTSGAITLDGVDINQFPLDEWRGRIAVGFQDFVRFELLAQQTVGVGDLEHIDDESNVLAALERAHAVDVVRRLGAGLRTQLGKSYADGRELSGGQWQKLALGRAMMRVDPLLLVLDEPTAALDAQAEHFLFERYAANARRVGRETGAITLLISHRFSTVRTADLIVVIADGRIAEVGDHDTLMNKSGLYSELYALHASAYQE